MSKRGSILLWIVLIVIIIIILAGVYFIIQNQKVKSSNLGERKEVVLKNPVIGLTDAEAVNQFNESFILYLLASINVHKLHNPPLSSDQPKIEIRVDNLIFSAIIDNEAIGIVKNSINNPDIRLLTTKEEAVKMLRDKNNIASSFNNGNSKVELVAGKATLFAKGYLNIYESLTGEKVT